MKECIKASQLREADIVEIAIALCDILSYLHGKGIIFRDLKPDNILVSALQGLKLIDFDIARYYRRGKRADTQPLGTPGYAAPETYGTSQSDERSDIYSLGATLHHLATGVSPEDHPFFFAPLRDLRTDISEDLAAIIHKALQKKPAQRFKSAGQMKRALQSLRSPEEGAVRRKKSPGPPFRIPSPVNRWKAMLRGAFSFVDQADPLIKAVEQGALREVIDLLARGHDINARSIPRHGRTALHCAAQHGHRDIVDVLVRKGARLATKDFENMTPRDLALFYHHMEIDQVLEQAGAPLHAFDSSGMMHLHKAAAEGNAGGLQALYATFPVMMKDNR